MDSDPGAHLIIVLLGHTGVGKSSSGNTILGIPAFESKASFVPVTREISEQHGDVCGKRITVIDTPGILQNETIKGIIKERCHHFLDSSKLCMFLVVVALIRFTQEQAEAVRTAVKVLGENGLKNAYMLFTSGDSLDKKSLHNFIFEDQEGELPEIIKTFAGYHVFNNKKQGISGQEQVQELLKMFYDRQTRKQEFHLPGNILLFKI